MIRVESITIKEFRGIRDLSLDFNGKNFAICGPNGTGKSGVVDALEFALTGNVSRLSGEGRGEISLKEHGPHVDRRNDPDKARVTVLVSIPSLSKSVTVERSLKNPALAKVTPSDDSVLSLLQHVKSHPEIVLSRRELIRYVLATPGKRAEEVQALLHLDQVEQVRGGLQKIANSCEKQLTFLEAGVIQNRDSLLRATGISELSKEQLLAAANIRRATLSLPDLTDLTDLTSLKDGMATQGPVKGQPVPKAQAISDIKAVREVLTEVSSNPLVKLVEEVKNKLTELVSDPALVSCVEKDAFYTTGMKLIDAAACPFCDTSWDLDALKIHIQKKIDHLKGISQRCKAEESKITPLVSTLRKLSGSLNTLAGYAENLTPPVVFEEAHTYGLACGTSVEKLAAFLPLDETIKILNNANSVPQTVFDSIGSLESAVNALPEPTKQDAAREWLTIAQERLEVYRDATRKFKNAAEQAKRARQVSDIYATTSDQVLTGIYSAVENDFASLYSYVNRDDEDKFKAKLVPSMGKLGFDVDFYGRGFFPPGAYHSEGHQDSMGLCLYLALMRHLQGTEFTFAVLDDVLMSVDAGHRREVCALLKKEFPNTQFIMTTHDSIWLRHMRTEGIIKGPASIQFRNWSVDQGPAKWDPRDTWEKIEAYRKENDVRAVASLLRHFLEYESTELCHRLRAKVEFRGDTQYQLGELLPPAITRLKDLYGRAKDAANSWNDQETVKLLVAREKDFVVLANTSNAEQWQVNVALHYNSWDNLTKEDFKPVVEAFENLLRGFTCSKCGEYLRVSPDRETSESLRCECGKVNFNLLKKNS